MDTIYTILSVAVGVVAGAVVALKTIAPKTKTLADDKVLERLVQLEEALAKLLGLGPDPKAEPKKPE